MSEVWITVAGLGITTALIRASGPVALGGRRFSERAGRVIALLPAAALAALVVAQTFGTVDGTLVLDERAAGVLAAAAVLLLRGSLLATVLTAAVVTAIVRALFG